MDILYKKPQGLRGRALSKRVYIIRKNPNSSTLQMAAMQIGKWTHFRILGSITLHYQPKKGRVFSSFRPKKPKKPSQPYPYLLLLGVPFQANVILSLQILGFLRGGHGGTSRLKPGCQMAGYAEYCVTTRKTLANKLFFCFDFVDFSHNFPLFP